MYKILLSLVFIVLYNLNLQAMDLLSESCNRGNDEACYSVLNIAKLHYDNKDYPKAIPILTTFCERGHFDSCHDLNNIGITYYYGVDVEINYQKASQLFLVSCEAGNGTSCDNLAIQYDKGIGFEIDQSKAMKFYSKACENGLDHGCQRYKELENQFTSEVKKIDQPIMKTNEWQEAGFEEKDAQYYIKNNVSVSEAKKWKKAWFRAKDACYYINNKITLSEAIKRVK